MSQMDFEKKLAPFLERMEHEGLSKAARASFGRSYRMLAAGGSGEIHESDIEPVYDLPSYDDLPDPAGAVNDLLSATVIIKLNGGLGTGMGLEKAKSLLPVRDGKTFLDLIVTQIDELERTYGKRPRFLLMNSFSTSEDTRAALASRHPHLGDPARLELLQNKVPKVLASDLSPAESPDQPELAWCPPGHGDLYAALSGSGTLEQLLADGVRYAFVSNSDNLGATPDPRLLSWFATSGAPFAMEVTRRSSVDRKGGHLARRLQDDQLVLRESAQCAPEDEAKFQDIDYHQYFNTNSLWIDLTQLAQDLAQNDGVLPLPTIRNVKTLDPRDGDSPQVFQLETAMGAAIECFAGAVAIKVPRSRFAPVKTCDDLLILRSDACEVRQDGSVGLVAALDGVPPAVSLDKAHYKLIDGLDALTQHGVPSLLECDSLSVDGVWALGDDVSFAGKVELNNTSADVIRLAPGRYQDHELKE